MATVEHRVKWSEGILGPLNKDDCVVMSKLVDELLKKKKVNEKQAKVLEKLDSLLQERIEEASTVGKVF